MSENEICVLVSQLSSMSSLPVEVLEIVIEHLDTQTLLRAREVSNLWKNCCTRECQKRPIIVKLVKSLHDFLVVNEVFEYENSPFPWSTYQYYYGKGCYTDFDFTYLFICKLGKYLKSVALDLRIRPDFCIIEYLYCIRNIRQIYFDDLFYLDERWFQNGNSYDVDMPKLEEICIIIRNIPEKIDERLYLLLQFLCKKVKRVDVRIFQISVDSLIAQRLASILCQTESVCVQTGWFNSPITICQILVDRQVRISCLKFVITVDEILNQDRYEKLILSISKTLRRLKIFFGDKVDNQRPFIFANLPQLRRISLQFLHGWWCKVENGQNVSYLSNLIPNKVSGLKTIKLSSCHRDTTKIPKGLEVFNIQVQFNSVLWLYFKGFDLAKLQNNFPRAKITKI